MGLRTYLPFLRVLAKKFCDYVERNRDRIANFVSPEQLDTINAACALVDDVITILDEVIPNPS